MGDTNVGGLVGRNFQGTVSNSYATGSVTGTGGNVGGLVGYNYQSTVSGSYATGAVTGDGNVGGLVGRNFEGTVSNSYATGAVTGSSDVGGLVGFNNGTITASYYSATTGQIDTGKGEGKATADLLAPTSYTGIYATWDDGPDATAGNEDDTDYWDFGTNLQYPVLKIDVDGERHQVSQLIFVHRDPCVLGKRAILLVFLSYDWMGNRAGVPEDAIYELTYSMGCLYRVFY